MGLLQRISDATRAGLLDIKGKGFGRSSKRLSELTDGELEEELLRRRRERAEKRTGQQRSDRDPDSPQRQQVAQWYANLELEPGAPIETVKATYKELMRKFHPDKHVGDPERHKAATELAQSLTRAYQSLVAYLDKRR